MTVIKKPVIFIVMLFCLFNVNAYALTPSAKSAVLVEQSTGKVLYEKNAHEKLPMASTTKIMTAICAIENGNLEEKFEIDKKAVGIEGSSMYLGYGEEITLKNLIYGLMLSSGNDAAVAIAIHISGSVEEFALKMNETAKKIGALNTSFENPNGLDGKNHYTTAYDLALITRYALKNEEFANIVKTYEVTIPWHGKDYDRTLKNHNKLLKIYDGATGVKTGFTKKSGRCLVSSAERDGLNVVAVTLNSPDDWQEHRNMLDYAFKNYEMKSIIQKGDYAGILKVEHSDIEGVKLEFKEDIKSFVKRGEKVNVSIKYELPNNLDAPVGFASKAGSAKIYLESKEYADVDIITSGCAMREEKNGVITNFGNVIIKYIHGIW